MLKKSDIFAIIAVMALLVALVFSMMKGEVTGHVILPSNEDESVEGSQSNYNHDILPVNEFQPLAVYSQDNISSVRQFYQIITNSPSLSWVYMECMTHSMYPTFTCEDNLVAVYPKNNANNMMVGDIVMFYAPNQYSTYILHRIIGTGDDNYGKYYETMGDNNTISDGINVRPYNIVYQIIGTYVK